MPTTTMLTHLIKSKSATQKTRMHRLKKVPVCLDMSLDVPNKDASRAACSHYAARPLHYRVIQAMGRAHGLDCEAFLSRLFWAHHCVITRPPALYLALLIVGLRSGRAEVFSPPVVC